MEISPDASADADRLPDAHYRRQIRVVVYAAPHTGPLRPAETMEELAEEFDYICEVDGDTHTVYLASPCARWTASASETLLSWTNRGIDLTHDELKDLPLHVLGYWLKRSGGRTLDIELDIMPDVEAGTIAPVMQVLSWHSDRWRTAEVVYRNAHAFEAACAPLGICTHSLYSLRLVHECCDGDATPARVPFMDAPPMSAWSSLGWDEDVAPIATEFVFFVHAPKLACLSLDGACCTPPGFSLVDQFPDVVSLKLNRRNLEHLLGPGSMLADMFKALEPLQKLRCLEFSDINVSEHWQQFALGLQEDEEPVACLEALEELTFHGSRLEAALLFTEAIQAPKLALLSCIEPVDDDVPIQGISNGPPRHFPKLATLRLTGMSAAGLHTNLSRLVRYFHRVPTVDIAGSRASTPDGASHDAPFAKEIAWVVARAGSGRRGGDWLEHFGRLAGLEIHRDALPVSAATLRDLVTRRYQAGGVVATMFPPPTALTRIVVCTSAAMPDPERKWFTKRRELREFAWGTPASRVCGDDADNGRNHDAGWMRLTFHPST